MATKKEKKFDYLIQTIRIRKYGIRKIINGTETDNARYLVSVDDHYSIATRNCEEKDLLKTIVNLAYLPNKVGQVRNLKIKKVTNEFVEE